MARRKKRTGKRRSGRRRVSGAFALPKQDEVMTGLGAILGLVGVSVINDQVSKMTNPIDPKLLAFGEVVLGFIGPKFLGGSPIVKGIGYGMIGAAGLNLSKEAGLISGLPIVSGYNNMRVINGPGIQDRIDYGPEGTKQPTASQVITGIMNSHFS